MIDASKVGVAAAQLMEKLEEDAAPGDDERIGEVLLLAEVRGEDEAGTYTYITWRCSDEREWVQRGLLRAGLDQERRPDLEADEDE